MKKTILLLTAIPLALAQLPGTFTQAGSMTAARTYHTATLLLDGKVLIAGGIQETPNLDPGSVLAGAELYDPATATFSTIGKMASPRFGHSATLLADGRVLIAGGRSAVDAASQLSSVELYDPATGTFAGAGDMMQPRNFHSAIALSDGRVLIAGGSLTNEAEVYDPSTGAFSSAGPLPLYATAVTLLSDGKVLIQGSRPTGTVDGFEFGAGTYDPATQGFSFAGPTAKPTFADRIGSLLTSGKVLDTPGSDECGYSINAAELYDPATGAFTLETMTTSRSDGSTTLLSDGTLLIAGGGDGPPPPGFSGPVRTRGAELYDPASGTFSVTGSMAEDRQDHTATILADGTVLVAGGWHALVGTLADAEIYHPKVVMPAPVLLSLSGDGKGAGAILHGSTQQVVSPANPAVAGEVVEIYGTGLIDGAMIPPRVSIGGRAAEVLFFGKAPGYAALNQINVRVPIGIASGTAGVRLSYIGRPSNEVMLAIQ